MTREDFASLRSAYAYTNGAVFHPGDQGAFTLTPASQAGLPSLAAALLATLGSPLGQPTRWEVDGSGCPTSPIKPSTGSIPGWLATTTAPDRRETRTCRTARSAPCSPWVIPPADEHSLSQGRGQPRTVLPTGPASVIIPEERRVANRKIGGELYPRNRIDNMADDISVTIGQVTELTLITPIIKGKAAQLRQVLQAIQVKPDSPIKKISTIHYARWVIIDNDTRLLFTSNFDGSWLDYLNDFSTLAPDGLDMIWSNCEGYPGARQFDQFTAWVRKYQVKVDLYYAAYPEASVKEVLKALDWKAKTESYLRELQKPPQGTP